MGVAQERASSVLWSAETAPKAMERDWLLVKWGGGPPWES